MGHEEQRVGGMPLDNSIAALATELQDWRRDFHRHPELGYAEHRTARVVAEKLRAFGLNEVHEGVGGTGVVGLLHGEAGAADEANTILLRADMDALPIHEADETREYRSETPGVMHACGHDGHTTMLLGAAKRLADSRNFNGSVVFIFQPAEEGGAGAKAMIEDGLFERFPCRAVYGMHNWPRLPVGEFSVRPGPVMAAADELTITLTGKGGHAAKPDRARDPVIAAAQIVTALQSIVARMVDPLHPAVLSITQIHAGTTFNVIPDAAMLSGTVRSFDQDLDDKIHDALAQIVHSIADAYGMAAEIERCPNPYPPTVNDPAEAEFAGEVLEALVGTEALHRDWPPTMGGEDFAFLAREKPGAFVFIGNGDSEPLHNAAYDFNDEVAPLGVAYWTRLVETALPRRDRGGG